MDVKINESWKNRLMEEFSKDYFQKLTAFVREEYSNGPVYPPAKSIFNAFDHCPFEFTKCVILGQDPYHGPGQANGLCFSVGDGIPNPPSLQNIFKELNNDLGCEIPKSGNLQPWAEQGVLLLNATLTVQARQAGSHQNRGWEEFTDAAIRILAEKRTNLVFILWGAYAQRKGEFIDKKKHFVIQSPHPSPFSAARGFFGSKPFSQTNHYLHSSGIEAIDWCLTRSG
jgi:uracil-DNA glycosylase